MLHLQLLQVQIHRSADAGFVAYVCAKSAHVVTQFLSAKECTAPLLVCLLYQCRCSKAASVLFQVSW